MQLAALIAVAVAEANPSLFCRHQTPSGKNHVKFVAGATSMSTLGQCMQQMGMGILKGIRTEFSLKRMSGWLQSTTYTDLKHRSDACISAG